MYAYEQGPASRARLELGREEAIEYRRETDRQHGEEIARLITERASFAESARKGQSGGSGRVQSEKSNVAKNLVAMSVSAVAGGATFIALKMLTHGSRD